MTTVVPTIICGMQRWTIGVGTNGTVLTHGSQRNSWLQVVKIIHYLEAIVIIALVQQQDVFDATTAHFAALPNANEMAWYVLKGDPHSDADELWSTMGYLYKGGHVV